MSWLRNWFGTSSKSRPSARRGKARLSLEALEDRTVPTVVFQPHFSGTAVDPGSSNYDWGLSGSRYR
jgi:hypothetical protein